MQFCPSYHGIMQLLLQLNDNDVYLFDFVLDYFLFLSTLNSLLQFLQALNLTKFHFLLSRITHTHMAIIIHIQIQSYSD